MSYGNWNARSPYVVQQQNGKTTDFETVKKHYESIKPLQGKRKTLDVRPWGERDRAHERVVKVSDTEYFLACGAYSYADSRRLAGEVEEHKRAMTFKQEGEVETIILHRPHWGWASPQVFYFYDFNLPYGMSLQKHKGTTYVQHKAPTELNPYACNYYTMDKGDITFYRPKGKQNWTPLHVFREVKHKLNRAKTKAIRAELQDFIDYAKPILPFVEGKYQWHSILGNDWRAELKREDKESYPEDWMSVLSRVVGKVKRYDYDTRTYVASEKAVINHIYREVYKLEKPLDIEAVELGQLCHDPYRSWV